MSEFNLNPDQQAAVDTITTWLKKDESPFFVLKGYSGTGKTYTMQALAASRNLGRIVYTAPTNKATKVLRETLTTPSYKPECCTIYSLLGLRLEANGEVRELTARQRDEEDKFDLSEYSLVVVDEGSMINAFVLNYIKEVANLHNVNFLFMGDPAQLPPVGEPHSPVWKIQPQIELTKVMRHGGAILDLATRLRTVVDHFSPQVNILSATDEGGSGVLKVPPIAFQVLCCERAAGGFFQKPAGSKVIAWRNVTVDKYNKLIRSTIFGESAVDWLPTDRLIATGPCRDLEDRHIANTDDEGEVTRAEVGWHPVARDVKIWNLSVSIDGGRVITLRALHSDGQAVYDRQVANLAEAARSNGRLWKDFWAYKELFHGVRHAYAITAHRSQGSTYDEVFVDYRDILLNRNRQEAFRCLYVACSRAKRKLILA